MPLAQQAPPRVKAVPGEQVANSWEDAADLSAALGVTLMPWQEEVLEASLGERHGGMWASRQIGLSAPRQNGKTQLLVARFLAGALLFGERKIIVSAHQQGTARESFQKFLEIYDESPALQRKVRKNGIMNAINRESITFTNGAKVEFKARQGATGRGFSCDCLLLDEAQILSERAWASINSTMSARPNPQVWLLGTPPTPEDDGLVFGRIRDAGIRGDAPGLTYVEYSATPEDDPALERTRWKANPSWNHHINHEVVQGEYETYDPETFARERLGIWDDDAGVSVIPKKQWDSCALDSVPESWPLAAVGVDMNPERTAITMAAAAWSDDGVHVEIVDTAADGVRFDQMLSEQVVDWLWQRCRRRIPVVLDAYTPARSLEPLLKKRKMKVYVLGPAELSQACGGLFDAVMKDKSLSHFGQPQLDLSLAGAVKEPFGKGGAWKWNRRSFDVDLTPIMAVTCAHFGAVKFGRRPSKESSESNGEVEVDVL